MSADGRSIRCLAIPPVAFYTNSSSAWSETVFELFKTQELDVDMFSLLVYPLRKGYTSTENILTSSSCGLK